MLQKRVFVQSRRWWRWMRVCPRVQTAPRWLWCRCGTDPCCSTGSVRSAAWRGLQESVSSRSSSPSSSSPQGFSQEGAEEGEEPEAGCFEGRGYIMRKWDATAPPSFSKLLLIVEGDVGGVRRWLTAALADCITSSESFSKPRPPQMDAWTPTCTEKKQVKFT